MTLPDLGILQQRLPLLIGALFGEPVAVEAIERLHGGAARETCRVAIRRGGRAEALILRRDPPSSLIATDRAAEYHALARAHAAGLPAPEPLFLDVDGDQLGAPGFLMREVAGGRAPGLFEADPYGPGAAALGRQVFGVLAALHRLVPDARDHAALPVHPPAARLAHWAQTLARVRHRPEPVADAALRWLGDHVPEASGAAAIVHGDFRSGNLLVSPRAELLAILDWEMAHIGDPMEDLAWAMDPLWAHGDATRAGAMLPAADVIAVWEAGAGRRFMAEAWPWWQLFAAFSGLVIWISSGAEIVRRRSVDPVLVFAATWPYRYHNARAAALLAGCAGARP